jgi:hypothetical protein
MIRADGRWHAAGALVLAAACSSASQPASRADGPAPPRADAAVVADAAEASASIGDAAMMGPDGASYATEDCTASAAGSLLCNTLRALPQTIGETGLFPAAPDFGKRPAGMRLYQPDPELWSDGMGKERYVLLPRGTRIDNSKPDGWSFPIGTVLIKTFFDDGPDGRRPIETRLIRRTTDAFFEYEYAVYQWNPDGKDARLLDIDGDRRTPVSITLAKVDAGKAFTHQIPSRMDCGKCHDASAMATSTSIIGFDELRLNGKLPGAARTQLEELVAAGLFTNPLPATPARINEADPLLLRIKTFIAGNCVHCHNGRNPGIVDFRPDVLADNAIGKKADSSGTTAPAGWLRVIPGNPEMSILFVQTSRKVPTGLNPMPPIGVAIPEPQSLADLKSWICGLPGGPKTPLAACR